MRCGDGELGHCGLYAYSMTDGVREYVLILLAHERSVARLSRCCRRLIRERQRDSSVTVCEVLQLSHIEVEQ